MYALRARHMKPCRQCHFRASTAELAELMCRSELNSSIDLNWFQTSCHSPIYGSGATFETGLRSVSVRIGDLIVSSQAL